MLMLPTYIYILAKELGLPIMEASFESLLKDGDAIRPLLVFKLLARREVVHGSQPHQSLLLV
jgi:hypothetical protein